MTIEDIREVLDDEALDSLDVTRRLGSWDGQEFQIRLQNWTFEDWRPRDDWFSVHGQVNGQRRSLRLFIHDAKQLDSQKRSHLFEVGNRDQRPPITVRAIVPDECSALSTGLFLHLLDYSLEEDESPVTENGCRPGWHLSCQPSLRTDPSTEATANAD